MIEKDRSLIGQMIQDFGRQPGVANVMLARPARHGEVHERPAAGAAGAQHRLADLPGLPRAPGRRSGTPARRSKTREGTVLRTMVPIRNHDACYRCHDPAQKVNGILVFDLDVTAAAGGDEPGLPLDGRRLRRAHLPAGRRHRPADQRRRGAAAAARRIDGPPHRQRRTGAARAGRGVRHHLVSGARVQHDGRLGHGPCSARSARSASASRPSSTASTTASSCSTASGRWSRPTMRSCSGPGDTASRCSGAAARTSGRACAR